jgi:hypothetical protein
MAIAVVFTPPSMNAEQYNSIIRRLEEAGAGAPEGRLYHVCHGSGNQLRVLDVWESEETFQRLCSCLPYSCWGSNPAIQRYARYRIR